MTTTKTNPDVSPSVALVLSGVADGATAEKTAGRSTAKIAAGIVATFLNSNEKIPASTDKDNKSVPMPRSLADLHKTKDQALWNGFLRSAYLHFLGAAPDPHPKGTVHVANDPVTARKAAEMRVRRGIELAVALSVHKDASFDARANVWTVPAEAVCKRGEDLPRSVKVVKLDGAAWYATKARDDGNGMTMVRFNATIDRVMQCNVRALQTKTTADGKTTTTKGDTRDTTTEPLKATEIATRGKVATIAAALRAMLSPDPTSGADGAVFWSDLSDEDRNALERLVMQVNTVKANGARPADARKTA